MSKVNVGVGDEFPVNEAEAPEDHTHPCARYRARWAEHRMAGGDRDHTGKAVAAGLGSLAFLSLATLAVLNPITTLAVTSGAALAYGAGRMRRRRDRWRRWRARMDDAAQGMARPRDAAYTDVPPSDKKDA